MACYATKYCIVKLKSLALAACLLFATSSILAAPEDEPATGVKRAAELASLIQLGEQMKTSVGEKTNQMLGQAMTLSVRCLGLNRLSWSATPLNIAL